MHGLSARFAIQLLVLETAAGQAGKRQSGGTKADAMSKGQGGNCRQRTRAARVPARSAVMVPFRNGPEHMVDVRCVE